MEIPNENVCCPYLKVIDCGDTAEHKHLLCGGIKAVISNGVAVKYCLGKWTECVGFQVKDESWTRKAG